MNVLGIILARAGSKGLPDKCVRPLLGRPCIVCTFEHARNSKLLTHVVLTTDSAAAKKLARSGDIDVIDRPSALATDEAAVDDAARHAVTTWEERRQLQVGIVVLLYANVPVRAPDLIDRAVRLLIDSGADSVRSVALVSKQHPDWIHRLHGDRLEQFCPNSVYRRQDLEPLYYHDGAAVAVTRDALFAAADRPTDRQAFWGEDRRAIVQDRAESVDIDEPVDFLLAEAILRHQECQENVTA